MNLIFVHGINQQSRGAVLRDEWLGVLTAVDGGLSLPNGVKVTMPFYGDALVASALSGAAVAQGADISASSAHFVASGMVQMAGAAGLSKSDIVALEREEVDRAAVEQAFGMDRRSIAVARALQRISPLHGRWAVRLLEQADAYLHRRAVADAVDAIVRPALGLGRSVVVSHSLGTVVVFKLLRALAAAGQPADIPLLVTIGSPLGLDVVRAALKPPFRRPEGVGRWINGYDRDDFVTLGAGLDEALFTGVENLVEVCHTDGDPHSLAGYLGNANVATEVIAALNA